MIALRPATEADLEFLKTLRRVVMYEHLERAGVAIDEAAQEQRILYRFDCADVVTLGGRAVGLLKVARDEQPWHLIQVQLLPELQGNGIGAQLVERVLSDAQLAGADVELSVPKGSPARRLYERLGFAIAGEGEHEHVMRWRSPRPSVTDRP